MDIRNIIAQRTLVAKQAAAAAADKLSREKRIVPHIKFTKDDLEWAKKLPEPFVKWFELGWGEEPSINYQRLLDEKKKNKKLRRKLAKFKKFRNEMLILIHNALITNTNPYNISVSYSRAIQLVVRDIFPSTQEFINTLNKYNCKDIHMCIPRWQLNKYHKKRWEIYDDETKKRLILAHFRHYYKFLTTQEHLYFKKDSGSLYRKNPKDNMEGLVLVRSTN